MDLNNEKIDKAEYDRFIDLMARMYLKYGTKYRLLTTADVMELFPETQCGTKKKCRRGA